MALSDFRSYADALLEVDPGPVVVTGPNGAGKTNLLEALSLLAPGRGIRGATSAEIARSQGPGSWAVAARLATELGPVEIGTGVASPANERRSVRIEGSPANAGDLGAYVSLLWVTPAMDRLFVDPPAERRRFLDRLVLALYPDHAGHVARYQAAMRARNRLLTDPRPADPLWLGALEQRMAEHGVAAAAARRHTVAQLSAILESSADSEFPRAEIALDGWVESQLETRPALAVEDEISHILQQKRGEDQSAGRASFGPHRADLVVRYAAKNQPAAVCSTGEQKALLIGLILAQAKLVNARTGRRPILLLDEVAAHLDSARRNALFERLVSSGLQAWMTGTDQSIFEPLRGRANMVTCIDGQLVRS